MTTDIGLMLSKDWMFRAATPEDAYALAELAIMGGDGVYEFLLEDMAPKEMLAGLMARSIKQTSGGFCWKHCFVAVEQGAVAGMINAFPAAWLRDEERDVLPQDRVQLLDPIDQAQDWESFLVNCVAVRPHVRRQGAATQLAAWAIAQAKAAGFPRLSANVWQDNTAARGLFEKQGFQVQARMDVAQHPGLAHAGGALLMTLVM